MQLFEPSLMIQGQSSSGGPQPRARRAGANAGEVWLRMVVRRDGNDLVAKCCMVKDADLRLFEVRVNLPETIRQAHALGARLGISKDTVSGFGSWIKKAVKSVAKTKIVKGVFKAVKTVASNPLTQIAVSVIPGGSAALAAVNAATKLVPGGSLASAVKNVSPKAFAAMSMATKTLATVKSGSAIKIGAKVALRTVARGNAAAALVKTGKLPAIKAAPILMAASKLRAVVAKNGAALTAKVNHADQVKVALANIVKKAKAGSVEAKVTSAVIARTATMQNQIAAAALKAKGGIPGVLLLPDGTIKKAPKGKWLRASALPMIQTLYQGAKLAPLQGKFNAVSGVGHFKNMIPHVGGHFKNLQLGPSFHPAAGISGQGWGETPPDPEGDHGPLYAARYDDPEAWPYVVDQDPNVSGLSGGAYNVVGGYQIPSYVGAGAPQGSRTEVRSPTRTDVRSPTRTRTEVRSPTRTATEVRSPTSTSTDAYTQGNFTATVTGGAGAGATHVHIHAAPLPYTLDSRGRKQLAKSSMDVDTSGPASDSSGHENVSGRPEWDTYSLVGDQGDGRRFQTARHLNGLVAGPVARGYITPEDATGLMTFPGLTSLDHAQGFAGYLPPAGAPAARKLAHEILQRHGMHQSVSGRPPLTPRQQRDQVIRAWLKAQSLKSSKVGTQMSVHDTDLPPELAEQSEDIETALIGCSPKASIAGFPSYLFTRKGLSNPTIRRRFAASLKAMPPKMRRRVMTRLKAALYRMRVSGTLKAGYPSIGSHRGHPFHVGAHWPHIGSSWPHIGSSWPHIGQWPHLGSPIHTQASGWTP